MLGVDFTEAMIKKARANAEKLNFNNVEFRLGDIDDMPVTSNYADVIVSNCVLNLVYAAWNALLPLEHIIKS